MKLRSNRRAPRERGFAMIAILALAALFTAYLIASGLNPTGADMVNEREQRSMNALRQAKAALIAYAASEQWQLHKSLPDVPPVAYFQPGALPCPDGDNDGDSDGICPSALLRIGRLPWKTIGTPNLTDANGERLWYAVSSNFRKLQNGTPPTIINSDTQGLLTVTGTAPAANVVAIVFAPGPPTRDPVSGQVQDRSAANVNRLASYLEGFTAGANDYTFTTNALPSDTFNDRVLVITQAELMAAVEPVVAARIERDIKPLVQSYFSTWGFYPFAVPFAAGPPAAQSDYKGVAGQTNGIIPITNAPFAWLNSGPDLITITTIPSEYTGSPTITSITCNGGVNLVCVIDYCCDSDDRPAIQLQAILSGPTTSFANGPPSALVGTLSMIDGNGNPMTGSSPAPWSGSSPSFTPTRTIVVQPKGLLVTYQGRLWNADTTNHQVTITVPGITNYLPIQSSNAVTNPTGAWFVANQWYRQTYYAVSPGHVQGSSACNPLPGTPSCLTVNKLPPSYVQANDKRAILVFAGRELNGLTPRPANLANYLEGANLTAANGTTPFVYEHRAGVTVAINDRVVVVAP